MSLRYVMLLQRDVPKAARFYSEGLGLHLRVLTDRWAELDGGGTTIALKAADGCAFNLCLCRSQRGPWFPTGPTAKHLASIKDLQGGLLHDRVHAHPEFHRG